MQTILTKVVENWEEITMIYETVIVRMMPPTTLLTLTHNQQIKEEGKRRTNNNKPVSAQQKNRNKIRNSNYAKRIAGKTVIEVDRGWWLMRQSAEEIFECLFLLRNAGRSLYIYFGIRQYRLTDWLALLPTLAPPPSPAFLQFFLSSFTAAWAQQLRDALTVAKYRPTHEILAIKARGRFTAVDEGLTWIEEARMGGTEWMGEVRSRGVLIGWSSGGWGNLG